MPPLVGEDEQVRDLRRVLAVAEHGFADTDARGALPVGIETFVSHARRGGRRFPAGRARRRRARALVALIAASMLSRSAAWRGER